MIHKNENSSVSTLQTEASKPESLAIIGPSHVDRWRHAAQTGQLPKPCVNTVFYGRRGASIWGDYTHQAVSLGKQRANRIVLMAGDFRFGNKVFGSERFHESGDTSGPFFSADKSYISPENDKFLFDLSRNTLHALRNEFGSRLQILFWCLTVRESENRMKGHYGIGNHYRHPTWNLASVIDEFQDVAINTLPLMDTPLTGLYLDDGGHPTLKGWALIYRLLRGEDARQALDTVHTDFARASHLLFPSEASTYRVNIVGNSVAYRAIDKSVRTRYFLLPPGWEVNGLRDSKDCAGRYDLVVFLSGLRFQDESPEQIRQLIAEEKQRIAKLNLGDRVVVIFWDAWARQMVSNRKDYRDRFIPKASEGHVAEIEKEFSCFEVRKLSAIPFEEAESLIELTDSIQPTAKGYARLFHLMLDPEDNGASDTRYLRLAEHCLGATPTGLRSI